MPILRLRPAGAQILDQRFRHYIGKRVSCPVSSFALGDLQPLAFPVDVVESQLGNLMCP